MFAVYKNTKRATKAYPQRQSLAGMLSVCKFGHGEHTSYRIPNLSFRRSIQTLSPDLSKRIANIVESRDIRDIESARTHVSLWYDFHIHNGDRASENCAYDFNELPKDRVRLRGEYTGGVLYWRSYHSQVVHSLPPVRYEFKTFAAVSADVCLQHFVGRSAVVDEVVGNGFIESKPGGDAGRTRCKGVRCFTDEGGCRV